MVVPLLGLGSNQKDTCNVDSIRVESYHLDDFRGSHSALLHAHLQQYTRNEKTTILLFLSPQKMTKDSMWYSVLLDIVAQGCISAVVIDEAHAAVQNYESFCPEFKTAMHSINTIVTVARRSNITFYVPILAM